LQKFTNFHAIWSWNFQNICNEIGWPRFFAPPCMYCTLVGQALTDVFTVSCLGWRNCIGTPIGLSFAYYVAPKNITASMALFRGSNTTLKFRLPAGASHDHSRNEITVIVSDGIGEEQNSFIYPVTVSNRYHS